MKRNPRYGPQPGERVRVKNLFGGYPLRGDLKDGDVVLLKSWEGGWYYAEFEGREVTINMVNIVKPTHLTDGRMLCPECNQTLRANHQYMECPGCPFRCLKVSPAAVIDHLCSDAFPFFNMHLGFGLKCSGQQGKPKITSNHEGQ